MNVETIQTNADNKIVKSRLRNHDPVTVNVALTRIGRQYGEVIAKSVCFKTITLLMETEGWSFFDAEGNSSPLL